jgi:glucose uptake protein GlcU
LAAYDPVIIQQFADALYKKASSIVAVCTIRGLLLGAIIAALAIFAIPQSNPAISLILWPVGPLFGALCGWRIGQARAFGFRLEAQKALCQLQIEKNTRTAQDTAVAQPQPLQPTGS